MPHERSGSIGKQRYPEVESMISEGKPAREIADHLNVDPETVRKFARRRGLTIAKQPMELENHPSWSGGQTEDRSGYILQRVRKDGPHGHLIRALAKRGKQGQDQSGYAPVHRIVMEHVLGRHLESHEVVDHIDGDKQNNDPNNLRVFASNAEHLAVTLKGKKPNWSEDGWRRMCAPRPHYRKKSDQP